jgi:NitT/TauT family transport system substrate-binding protein
MTQRLRPWQGAAGAVLLALFSAACRTDPNRVRIAIFRGEELTPLARALGNFEREGLEVEIHEVPSSGKAMEALFGGSVEAVGGGYDHAVRLASQGRQTRSFTVLTIRSLLALVASPKARHMRRIEDLKGATVGVSALGSSGNHFVNLLLVRHGLSPKDIQVIGTGGGHSVTVAAAESGRVDAIVTLPVSFTVLRARHPDLAVLADGQTAEGTRAIFGVDQYPALCLMAEAAWLERNRDTAARMARAMVRTLEWVRGQPAEQVQKKLARSGGNEELEGLRATMAACSPDGRMPAGGPEAVRDAIAVSSPEVRQVDLKTTYTDEFVGAK